MLIVAVVVLTIAGLAQIALGILVSTNKFDPLLPHERKKLPAKVRKRARRANAVSMIGAGLILIALAVGILLDSHLIQILSAVAMIVFAAIMLVWSLKLESKYLKQRYKQK